MIKKYLEKYLPIQHLKANDWLNLAIILFSLLVGIYLNFELINVILFSSIIAVIVLSLPSRFIGLTTIVLLLLMSFASHFNRQALASELSVWVFYYLFIYAVKAVLEVLNWDKVDDKKIR